MSTTKCGHTTPCGCADVALTTPAPCNPVGCPDPYPCSEVINAECVIYTGDDILCDQTSVVSQGMNTAEAMVAIVDYFCSFTGSISGNITCGDNTVVTAGSTFADAFEQVVDYFCQNSGGSVSIIEAGAGISVSEVTVDNTTTYTVAIQDTGWTDLEGFAYYQSGMSTNKPQVRKIGKQIHFRGDLYLPLSDGTVIPIPLTTPDTYRTVQRKNPFIGNGGLFNDGTGRLLFNSNGSAAQSVIPTSVLPALTNLDGTYKLSRLIATRQIEILSNLVDGQSGSATLTAPVTIEILSNKTLRVTALQQLEQNSADIVSFDGNSSLRNLTSSYESRDRIINLSDWVNSSRSGLNSRSSGARTVGTFLIGRSYMIYDYNPGDDFTNIGGLNVSGNVFTATGGSPTAWTNQSIVYELDVSLDVTSEFFFNSATSGAAQWNVLLDGTTFNAGEFNSLGGFKISLDGLIAYIA
jgi:hypothetical protein